MANNITFTMVKPSAFEKNYTGNILAAITDAGFRISAIKTKRLTVDEAQRFYEVHKERPFYNELVEFMSSGPITLAILEKENAVEDYRALIGNTDPKKATEGTIRYRFGESIQANAVHGSDSDENAEKECSFFFSASERF
jgi:nucleoside-diphosphate kinase